MLNHANFPSSTPQFEVKCGFTPQSTIFMSTTCNHNVKTATSHLPHFVAPVIPPSSHFSRPKSSQTCSIIFSFNKFPISPSFQTKTTAKSKLSPLPQTLLHLAPFPEGDCTTISLNTVGQFGTIFSLPHNRIKRHIVLTQETIGNDFDPDLYARWGQDPTTESADYADFSLNELTKIDVHPTPAQIADENLLLHLGAYSYRGTGQVKICVRSYDCVNQNCGVADFAQNKCIKETGVCECAGDWKGDDCSIKTVTATFDAVIPVSIVPTKVLGFKYNVPASQTSGELQFSVLRPASLNNDVIVRARHGFLPTEEEYDYILEQSGFTRSDVLRIIHPFASGDWYFTVTSSSIHGKPFDLEIRAVLFNCPNNCSGNGTCQPKNDAFECHCNTGYTTQDCSLNAHPLTPGETSTLNLAKKGNTVFHFNVQKHVENMNVELLFKYTNNEQCGDLCPEIFVSQTTSAETRATREKYTVRSPYPAPQEQSISLSDHDTRFGGYTVTIQNPSNKDYTGKIGMVLVPHCPKDCNGHGTCNPEGFCECHDGYHSSDCSVTKDMCEKKYDDKSGFGSGAIALSIILGLLVGGVVGVFAFKFSAKTRAPRRGQGNLEALNSSEDQYAQLN